MPNGNQRGNSYSRRARKLRLLNRFGDGVKAPCWECGDVVDYDTMVVDRKIPYTQGGTYHDDNTRVHCHLCSDREGARIANERKREILKQWERIAAEKTNLLRGALPQQVP